MAYANLGTEDVLRQLLVQHGSYRVIRVHSRGRSITTGHILGGVNLLPVTRSAAAVPYHISWTHWDGHVKPSDDTWCKVDEANT